MHTLFPQGVVYAFLGASPKGLPKHTIEPEQGSRDPETPFLSIYLPLEGITRRGYAPLLTNSGPKWAYLGNFGVSLLTSPLEKLSRRLV